jgi:tripartite-type tricarboxylate transporter receptor subunit TctC
MIARHTVAAAIVASLTIVAAAAADAQNYPDHPITMIVPLAPGGSTDTLGPASWPRP